MAMTSAATASFLINSPKHPSFHVTCHHPSFPPPKSSLSLPKSLSIPATIIATMASSPFALAAKQIAESPQEDNRGLALLLPIVPAVGWVLFNILGPALNQVNRMRNEKAVILGLGGLGACCAALYAPVASAVESEAAAAAAEGGGGSGLLPYIVAAAVGFEVVLLSVMQSKYEEKKE
ncbi:hypothetical protein RND81_04G111300 [Saponaria officinalis]